MKKLYNKLSEIYYPEQIYTVKGINLTKREIDIIACLVCRRAASIPQFLSISSRTVESHIRNITQKLGCNSRDSIIGFIENSDKMSLIKNHYQNIVHYYLFEKLLKEIAVSIKKENPLFVLLLVPDDRITHDFMRHLDVLKIDTSFASEINMGYTNSSTEECTAKRKKDILFLSIIDKSEYESKCNTIAEEPINEQMQRNANIYIQLSRIYLDKPKLVEEQLYKLQSYFDLIFKLLEINYSPHIFEQHMSAFKQQCLFTDTKNTPVHANIINTKKTSIIDNAITIYIKLKDQLPVLPRYTRLSIVSILFIFIISSVFMFVLNIKTVSKPYKNSIHSDLQIPSEAARLNRTGLIKQINEKMSYNSTGKDNVNHIVWITGIAGSGKTTLARIYARTQSEKLVWEINSETRETLIDSFFVLTYSLSNTNEKSEEVDAIKSIQDKEAREFKLSLYIANRIKNYPNWILIFDNLNSVDTLKHFLPRNISTWGGGKTIITSRDSKIMQSEYLGDMKLIKVDQLSKEESITLFCSILYNKEVKLLSDQEKNLIVKFLTILHLFLWTFLSPHII